VINWDILNETFTPEDYAEQLIIDENLPYEFKALISLQIRKQIKNYIFKLLNNYYNNYEKYNQKDYLDNQRIRRKEEKNIISFLFDPKLEDLLGNKRKRDLMENEEKLNKKIKNDLIKECNSESIKIDKKLFTKYINSKKEYDYEKKKNFDSEQISISGNDETENNSKHSNIFSSNSNLNTLEKELNENIVIQLKGNGKRKK
jgi:hypothetical protein